MALRANFGNNENGMGRVAHAIDNGKIPSIDAIKEEIGEHAIRPILLVCAITHGTGDREAGGLKAFSHSANAIIRNNVYGMSLQNTPESMNDLSIHDMGEDNGKTLAEIIALNRFAGAVFGREYEIDANLLTDYNTALFKMATGSERKLIHKKGITLDDVCTEIADIVSYAGVKWARHQKSALQAMNARIKKFRSDVIASEEIIAPDKEYISEFALECSRHLISLSKQPYPRKVIERISEQKAERYLTLLSSENVRQIIEHDVERGVGNQPMTFFARSGNPLFHAIRKIGYSAYVEDIFASNRRSVRDCKVFDRADNRRVDLYDTVRDCGISYMKTAITLKEMQDYMDLNLASTDAAQLGQLYRFLAYQQIYRVLHDINTASTQVDTSYRKYEFWLDNQFIYTYDILTKRNSSFMQEFRRDLVCDPETTMAILTPIAQRLAPIFDLMERRYVHWKGSNP